MRSLPLSAVAMAIVLSAAGAVHAQVNCGDVITDDAVMNADLVCGANDPAVTVNGGTLDMNGHRISGCLGDGIVVVGTGARVENGSVDGCAVGVRLEGGGGHYVRDLVASDSFLDGFRVSADGNKLTNTSAVGNIEDGYDITGDQNTLKDSFAINNLLTGFRIAGARNKLHENTSSSNTGDGYGVSGDGNKFVRNIAESNNSRNYLVTGISNQLTRNVASRSTFEAGIEIVGNDNKLSKNVAVNNGNGNDPGVLITGNENRLNSNSSSFNSEAGFEIAGNDNVLIACKAAGNTGIGFEVVSGSGNEIKRSRAYKSTLEGIRLRGGVGLTDIIGNVSLENTGADLRDDNADCGDNRWDKNIEATVDPASCVQ
jgi:hypothetical protein